jgi:phospholipid/cholesterol/gamma-HCH transport system permease protein
MEWALNTISRYFPFVVVMGKMTRFFLDALAAIFTPKFYAANTLEQMQRMCVHCMIPILFVLAPMGAVVAMESLKVFSFFGASTLTSSLLSVALFREIAPVMVAIMVASQTGAEIAAELGAMRVRNQIDAMEVMSVDPLKALIVPRLLAGFFITPILNIVGTFTGIIGGYIIAVMVKGSNGGAFIANLFKWVDLTDVIGGVIKAAVFGVTVMLISCYHGFYTRGGAAGVGQATNDSVVRSVVSILVLNYFLTTAFFGFDL